MAKNAPPSVGGDFNAANGIVRKVSMVELEEFDGSSRDAVECRLLVNTSDVNESTWTHPLIECWSWSFESISMVMFFKVILQFFTETFLGGGHSDTLDVL